jgi:hypothetical protein
MYIKLDFILNTDQTHTLIDLSFYLCLGLHGIAGD